MSRPSNVAYLTSISLTLALGFLSAGAAGTTHDQTQDSSSSPPAAPLPLEQLISNTRKQHGDLIVRSARLTRQDKKMVYVINFTDSKQQWVRSVYDAHTAELLSSASLKAPMPIEKSLTLIYGIHPKKNLIRSWLEQRLGELVRVTELADHYHKRYEIIQDAYTGQLISENSYDLKPSGKEISLNEILKQAREKHQGMVVLQTRSSIKNNAKIREIIYLDKNHLRHKMTVDAITGELLEDKITPWMQI